MDHKLLLCAIFLNLVFKNEAANILYAFPMSAPSHYTFLRPIGLELAKRGHNVTVIVTHSEKEHPESYHQIIVDNKSFWDLLDIGRPNVFTMVNYTTEEFYNKIVWPGGIGYTELSLNSTSVQEFLKKDNKFDLVISEIFYNEAFYALAHKYNAPLVLVSTFGNCMRQNIMSRNPLQFATVVAEYLSLMNPTSFFGRVRNLYFTMYEYFWWRFWYMDKQEELVKKYIPGLPQNMPSLYELHQNASLIIYNSYFSFDNAVAYLPNIIEAGGLHITESKNKLSQDLQDIMDKAKDGVVYINFGSNVQSNELPEDKKQAFLKVFARLKQTVIWKWEEDNLENKPDNLITRKWFPQKEILAHPNIKVFVSHGGLLGTQEALYNGVPLVGVPVFADQYNNLLQVENNGHGRVIQLHEITEESLYEVLTNVLNDEKYQNNANLAARRFKDRPMTPLNTAIYWIEYVIRNKGAEFIKNPALKLSWIQYAMLDVYAFFSVSISLVLYIIVKIMLSMKRFLSAPKKSTQTMKNKKKQ